MTAPDPPAPPGSAPAKTLIFLVGPPAVGKMTVGHELAARTGMKLFHNHQTIELVLGFFPFDSPPFDRLVRAFRRGIFEEVAASTLPGLIFTYVWAFDEPDDDAFVAEFSAIFERRGGRALFVELEASLDERLRRNETGFRLEHKPSKRDTAASRQRLLDYGARYQLSSGGRFNGRADWMHIDNTHLEPADAAARIIAHFALPCLPTVAVSADR
ncbi:AAA family ATPase [soil metagenome]